jgi:RND family efflux transporter MFP subunit
MAVDDRLSDLLVDWEQGRRAGLEPSLEELCRDTPDLLSVVKESIDCLKATDWMFRPEPSEPCRLGTAAAEPGGAERAALHDTELPASHLTVQEFAASIFQSGLLSQAEIDELKQRLDASALPGEAREVASRLVTEGKLTRYQASVLLKASKDPLLVDNYVILDTLDTGGMGLVFKALHRSMNRVVALKLLPSAMMSARDTVKRFQREVQAAAALKHPNIVAAFDADESEEIAYLVLEYVDGTNLYRLVKEQGPRPLAEGVEFVRQAAAGLAYLHSRGIIHRDVKPANLLLAKDGTVKLLDMGLVRFASSEDLSCSEMDQELTQAGIVIGTVAYMSPEQALDTRSADQRSDIYSLGCTLFYLLTGRSLYHEETGMKTLLAHREQPVPSLREFCEEAPVSLDAVFRTMVAKRPADRLQSMDEVIAALDACVPPAAAPTGRACRPVPSAPPLRTATNRGRAWQSRRFRITAAITALAAALIGSIYLAVIVIRITTSQGTTEVTVKDPNAKIEIASQPQGPSTSQSQAPAEMIQPGKIEPRPRWGVFSGIAPAAKPRPPVPVVTATVRKGDFDVHLSDLEGTVRASQTVTVRSAVDGEICNVNFTEGQFVHMGDVLFEVVPRPYKLRLDEAQAKLAQDEHLLARAQAELRAEEKSRAKDKAAVVARYEALVKNDDLLVDQYSREFKFNRSQIVAPISGRIGLRALDKGNLVQAANSTTLATIAQFQPIDIFFHIPQDQVEHVQQKLNSTKETTVEIWNHNRGAKIATAQIVGIDNTVNSATGLIRAKARAANDDNHLFPGEFVGVRLLVDTLHDAMIVPTNAIQHGPSETFAFVVKPDQTVEKRKLVVRASEKDISVVTSGLSPGDVVVVEGTHKLVEGYKVEIQNSTAKATGNLDRQVADWVLANRGTISLKEFRGRSFQFVDALPPTEFQIEAINLKDYVGDDSRGAAPAEGIGRRRSRSGLGGRRMRVQNEAAGDDEQTGRTFHRVEFSEADLDRLASLTELRWLTFASSAVTDDVLAHLKALTKLESLGLEGSSITDAGLSSLVGMTQFTNLDLDSTAVTDAGLKEIAKLKSLNDLSLIPEAQRSGRIPRTDPSLRLGQTRTTVHGIDELQRALPNCIVFASHLPGYSPAPPAPGRSDRDWAQWLLSTNQSLGWHIFTDLDPETPITRYEDLPPVNFHIVQVGLNSYPGMISETVLRRLAGLPKLRRLDFKNLSADAFAGLGEIKQLEGLWIEETDATDDALQALGKLTGLKLLQLGDKYFTDRDLARLAPLHDLTALRLNGKSKGLHGSGFGVLSPLTHLESLDLDSSGIEDEAMAPIGKLVSLEDLDLSRTWITGKGLASLAPLSRLRKLQLSGCRRLEISSLETLARLPHLESLTLYNCPIDDSAVETLKKLTSLRELFLDRQRISPAAFQPLLATLPNCSINGTVGPANSRVGFGRRRQATPNRTQPAGAGIRNEATQPDTGAKHDSGSGEAAALVLPPPRSTDRTWAKWILSNIHASELLTDLDPESSIAVQELLPPIDFHITQLQFGLEFRGNNPVGAVPKNLKPRVVLRLVDLPQLERLTIYLPDNTLIPAIATLKRLKWLSFMGADNLNDDAFKTIGSMTNLTGLQIDGTRLTDGDLKDFARLTGLTTLSLRNARDVHGSGLKDLGALTKLAVLGLFNSGLDDAGLAEVARFPNLERLNLSQTWISPKGLSELARLPNLKHLELDGCRRINDSALAELVKLKHLRSLNLDKTRVTGEIVPELQSNLPDCSITWPAQAQQAAQMRMMRQRQGQTPKSR